LQTLQYSSTLAQQQNTTHIVSMEHVMDEEERKILEQTDFVLPLKRVGVITRAVLEAVRLLYSPRRIVVVAPRTETHLLRLLSSGWEVGALELIAEEDFFARELGLSLPDILAYYGQAELASGEVRGEVRDPGWWLQQLIKLGASTQVPNISPVYVVWDADLVPIRRWRLCSREGDRVTYYTAILQAEPRSDFNTNQYAACMQALCGLVARQPEGGGTFVSHHMCLHTAHVAGLLRLARQHTASQLPWPQLVMSFSQRFYRFSEYKTYATYALHQNEALSAAATPPSTTLEFRYHALEIFGAGGLRFRQTDEVLREMISLCGVKDGGIPYAKAREFAKLKWSSGSDSNGSGGGSGGGGTGYLQLDHVYGLGGIELNLTPPVMQLSAASSDNQTVGRFPLGQYITEEIYFSSASKVTHSARCCALSNDTLGDSVDNYLSERAIACCINSSCSSICSNISSSSIVENRF
jgi:hypothetical protein